MGRFPIFSGLDTGIEYSGPKIRILHNILPTHSISEN